MPIQWFVEEEIKKNENLYSPNNQCLSMDSRGFSMIDLVESVATRRKYALKRMTCHSKEDEAVVRQEIHVMTSLEHKNVIRLIEYMFKGSADIVINTTSQVYLVLPYYKNGSLHDNLMLRSQKQDYMGETQILHIFLGICEGLRAMHEASPAALAHRDLKTANVCLSDSMEPVLVDLGSAAEARMQICGQQEAQKLQDTAEERCSIVYRAPELFNVESYCMIDERTDIWSLGCVLYAMCYFKCPFDAAYERGDSVALAVLSGNIVFPEIERPYHEDMRELIMFMLRLNPMERPFIYSVIEKVNDLLVKLEGRV